MSHLRRDHIEAAPAAGEVDSQGVFGNPGIPRRLPDTIPFSAPAASP
jgi:hypothetical protein